MKSIKPIIFSLILCLFVIIITGCENKETIRSVNNGTDLYKNELYNNLEYEELIIALPFRNAISDYDDVIAELNKLTVEHINAKITFVYFPSDDALLYINSGNCDIIHCNNSMMFIKDNIYLQHNNNLPYLVSQGLIKDITDMLPKYAPTINKAYGNNQYFDYIKYNHRIYGVPIYEPMTEMPMAIVKKKLINSDIEIQSMEDVYLLLDNNSITGDTYYISSMLSTLSLIDMFANINDLYKLPSRNFDGYLFDEINNLIIRFEDSNIVDDMNDYYHYLDKYGKNLTYEKAIIDDSIGVILTNVRTIGDYVGDKEYNFYPLYKDKKFALPYNSINYLVIPETSGKYERSLIFLDYLYSNKHAYDLVTIGIPGVNYNLHNGNYIKIKPVTILKLFDSRMIIPTWSDSSTFYNTLNIYLKNIYIPDFFTPLYSDYNTLSEYCDLLYGQNDIYEILKRNEIILPYIFSSKDKDKEKEAYQNMLHLLGMTSDRSEELYIAIKDLFN